MEGCTLHFLNERMDDGGSTLRFLNGVHAVPSSTASLRKRRTETSYARFFFTFLNERMDDSPLPQ